jgi:hypothetical protein
MQHPVEMRTISHLLGKSVTWERPQLAAEHLREPFERIKP